jgi:alcohol dehydrogenase class IV
MLTNWNYTAPLQIFFGPDSIQNISTIFGSYKGDNLLIVTDKVIREIGIMKKVEEILKTSQINYFIYDNITSEPTIQNVLEGLEILKKGKCNLVIGLGGGSSIDTAKAISMMAANNENIYDYKGVDKVKNKGVPVIAIPTTAGTGSEVTKYTIITDIKTDVKLLIGSNYIIPDIAIVDPILTLCLPKKLTSSTGIDALTHAIEAYTSIKANPLSDLFAIEAIKLISQNLREAWSNGSNISAREKLMLGSMYAGIAFNNSSVGLVHGMSRPIGANFHIAHGTSNAVLLGVVMEYTSVSALERYFDIARALGLDTKSFTTVEAANAAVLSIKKLIKDLEIPPMADLITDKQKFIELVPKMAQDAIDSGSPGNNARTATKNEIIDLYLKSF